MITPQRLRDFQRALQATFPLISAWRRRRAIEALFTHRNDPSVIAILVG